METLKLGNADLDNNLDYIFILTVLQSFIAFFTFYTSNFNRIVIPNLITNFLFKLFLPALILLFYFDYILEDQLPYYLIGFSAFALAGLVIYTGILGQLKLKMNAKIFRKDLIRRMSGYWLFGLLQNVGSMLAFRIDVIMVAMMLGYSFTGIYSIVLVLATMIEIPNKSIIQISGPIISEAWTKNQIEKIAEIYKKSSLNLIVIGLFLFGGSWLLLDDVFMISTNTKALADAKYVFLFLALAKLIDLATSVNTQIIIYSKYFRYNLLFVVSLGIMNTILNYYLIGKFELLGAAIATCLSIFIYNIMKLIFILVKVKIQPFSINTLRVLGIFTLSFVVVLLIPSTDLPLLNMLIKGGLFSMIFISTILFFKISEDIQQLVFTFVDRFKKVK
jgi:O-antigen/teichoic acid export membrane protein